MSMYPEIDQNGDNFIAYSMKAIELTENILVAAGAHNNFCMENFLAKISENANNIVNRINFCVKV
jgi:hypothetical protein